MSNLSRNETNVTFLYEPWNSVLKREPPWYVQLETDVSVYINWRRGKDCRQDMLKLSADLLFHDQNWIVWISQDLLTE